MRVTVYRLTKFICIYRQMNKDGSLPQQCKLCVQQPPWSLFVCLSARFCFSVSFCSLVVASVPSAPPHLLHKTNSVLYSRFFGMYNELYIKCYSYVTLTTQHSVSVYASVQRTQKILCICVCVRFPLCIMLPKENSRNQIFCTKV